MRTWALGLVLVVVAGCGAGGIATVRERASIEWRCPAAEVEVQELPGQAFLASGCGRRMTYMCLINGFGEALICTADSVSSAGDRMDLPRESRVDAPSWSDDTVRGLLRAVNAQVLACFPPDHAEFDVRVQISEGGRITHSGVLAGAATEDQQRCVTSVFTSSPVEGRAARPRTAVLHFVPGVPAPAEGSATSGGEAPATSGGEPSATEPTAFIAARLDARRDAILACADASRIGVSASWDEGGDVTLSLRGERAGGAEESCIRTAVGPIRIEPAPGAAGSMVHPVTD